MRRLTVPLAGFGGALLLGAAMAWAATALWPGSLYTWSGASKFCAATGAGGNLWDPCTVDDPDCGTSPPAGSCVATILPGDFDQVAEEVEALEAYIPTSRTKGGAAEMVTADAAGTSGRCGQWAADGALGSSTLPCGEAGSGVSNEESYCATIVNLATAFEEVLHGFPVGVTMETVACGCFGTCSTPAVIELQDAGGTAMTPNVTCAANTTLATTTLTGANTLSAWEGWGADVTNTPSPSGSDTYVICGVGSKT